MFFKKHPFIDIALFIFFNKEVRFSLIGNIVIENVNIAF